MLRSQVCVSAETASLSVAGGEGNGKKAKANSWIRLDLSMLPREGGHENLTSSALHEPGIWAPGQNVGHASIPEERPASV